MKKNLFITVLLIIFICNIEIIMCSVRDASILFFNKIFISTFPFMILSDILFYFDYHVFLSNSFLGKFISKLFKLNIVETTVFIFSIFTSQPNNAVYIKKLLDENAIDINDACNLLIFTYFPSISFVIGTVGIIMFNNIKIGLFLYLNAVFNNILICLFLKRKIIPINHNFLFKKDNFINTLKNSIIKVFNNSFIILGNLIIFTIIINLITKFINNGIFIILLSSFLEVTTSLNNISISELNMFFKVILSAFSINFSGLSILFQSFSILGDYQLDIKKILIIKLIFSLISSFLLSMFLLL